MWKLPSYDHTLRRVLMTHTHSFCQPWVNSAWQQLVHCFIESIVKPTDTLKSRLWGILIIMYWILDSGNSFVEEERKSREGRESFYTGIEFQEFWGGISWFWDSESVLLPGIVTSVSWSSKSVSLWDGRIIILCFGNFRASKTMILDNGWTM